MVVRGLPFCGRSLSDGICIGMYIFESFFCIGTFVVVIGFAVVDVVINFVVVIFALFVGTAFVGGVGGLVGFGVGVGDFVCVGVGVRFVGVDIVIGVVGFIILVVTLAVLNVNGCFVVSGYGVVEYTSVVSTKKLNVNISALKTHISYQSWSNFLYSLSPHTDL